MFSPLLFVLIGAIFGFLAALGAFLITFEEYKKHFLAGSRPFHEAFRTALLTFFIFVALAFIAGYILSKKIL
ncbi:MAG: hypothetical protein A2Z27_01455 [candidate division Zixibacteria bacterium RBG_16_50_21]|nr:MAG: hypothetical protein A2Z27_01455 [candidate division Zixibacteria bacterium RBG_16_50_21]